MRRSVPVIALGFTLVLVAAPALAGQCPKLIAQIDNATGIRFDPTAANAKVKARQAAALHAQGKHAESEKIAKEALASLGIK
jgi:hypothetical protein